MNKNNIPIILLGLILGITILPSLAFAKLDITTIKTNPETPGPNQKVTISLISFTTDYNSADITWYVNGEAMKSGLGLTSFETGTGDFGVPITVDIVGIFPGGNRVDKQIILKPVEVDLLWETDSYVPPFYKGKALPGFKSIVRVTAIPRVGSLESKQDEFYYEWKMNSSMGLGGGFGKSSALVPMGYAGGRVPVTVITRGKDGTGKGSATKYITPVETRVAFYEQDPLFGIRYNKALRGSVTAANSEFLLRMVPYYFSTENIKNGEIVYSWKKDGRLISLPGFNPFVFSLNKTGAEAETISLSIEAQNTKRLLQLSNANIAVNFSAEKLSH